MKYEETLENIKSDICYNQPMCADGICKGTEENPCAIDIALDCIEKQIPKKPRHEHLNFYCPNCGNWLLWDDAEPNDNDLFCPKCSQRIDWSDENDEQGC